MNSVHKSSSDTEGLRTRDRILVAAAELFAEHGYADASMRQLAKASGITPGAVYVHFKDKRDVLISACDRWFRKFDEKMDAAGAEPDPVARIRRCGKIYCEFGIAHPHAYRLMFMTPVPAGDRESDVPPSGYFALRETCAQAIATGRMRPHLTDAELAAQTFWAGVHGVTSLEIVKSAHSDINFRARSRRIDTMLDALLDGLVQPQGKRK